MGDAAFNGTGQVTLDGTSGTYVNLPGGLVSSLSAVTFEAWVNIGDNPNAVTLFGFGSAGTNYIRYQPRINAWYNDQRNMFEIPNDQWHVQPLGRTTVDQSIRAFGVRV